MKAEWQTKKLSEVCGFQNGFAFKSSDYSDSGYFVMRIGNVQDGYISLYDPKYITKSHKPLDRFVLQSGDILISLTGNVGRVGVIKREHLPAVINQRVARIVLKDKDSIQKQFLLYFLSSTYFIEKLIGVGHGAAQQNISTKDVENLEISFPSLTEQKKIVKIIDDIFDKVVKAKENAEKNLKNSKELFESHLQNIFSNPGKDWEEKKLVEVCELKSGTTIPPKLEKQSGDILYVKVGDMNLAGNEVEINTSSRFINSDDLNSKHIIPQGSVIFPKRGGAIFTNKRRKIIKPTIVDLNTMALVPSKLLNSDLLYYWFLRIDLRDLNNGSSIPQINNYSFDNVFILYPASLTEQKSIVKKLDALSAETKKLESIYQKKLANLEELKKSILQKAFSGAI